MTRDFPPRIDLQIQSYANRSRRNSVQRLRSRTTASPLCTSQWRNATRIERILEAFAVPQPGVRLGRGSIVLRGSLCGSGKDLRVNCSNSGSPRREPHLLSEPTDRTSFSAFTTLLPVVSSARSPLLPRTITIFSQLLLCKQVSVTPDPV